MENFIPRDSVFIEEDDLDLFEESDIIEEPWYKEWIDTGVCD